MKKNIFIEKMKDRTRSLSIEVIQLCDQVKTPKSGNVITKQLVRSATQIGIHYRAASVARSGSEFFNKVHFAIERSQETEFWLDLIGELGYYQNEAHLKRLQSEAKEISRILTKIKSSTYTPENEI